jgi:hypothetical protein
MKSFVAALVAAVVLAIAFVYALDGTWQRSADQAFASATGVRLPDHGTTHNLVGKDWYSAKEH